MAINSTRGLPSFAEMYEAYKNRGSLGQSLQAGVEGLKSGIEIARKGKETDAEAKLKNAQALKAETDAKRPKEGFIRIDQIIDPREKADLAQYATANEEGVLVVPQSTYNAVTKRGQGAETLDLKAKLAAQQAEADAARIKAEQERLALQQELGPRAQATSAAKGLGELASKVDAPTIPNRILSFGKETIGMEPTAAVLAERQRQAAAKRLEELQGNASASIVDTATGLGPDPLRTQAIQELNAAGMPTTEANINEAMRQLRMQLPK